MDAIRDAAGTVAGGWPMSSVRRITSEGLYGRPKMARVIRRRFAAVSPGAIDRTMTALALRGVRCSMGARTTLSGKGDMRAGDLLIRDFIFCRT